MPLNEGKFYRGIIKEVMENACMVEFEDGTYQKAVIMFPYYSVEKRYTAETFGHGIVYKPAIWSPCICALIGEDLHIMGFAPPLNVDKLVTQEITSGTEDLDQPYKGADELIAASKKNQQINQENAIGHEDSYEYNDEEKTQGDMGFVAADGNRIMAYAFGLCVTMASNFCFRLYSKLNHSIREGFKNLYRYSPNVTEFIRNDQENGSRWITKAKNDYKDETNFMIKIIGNVSENIQGYMRRFISKPDDSNGERTETIDLDINYTCSHKASGSNIYSETIGESADGRQVNSKNHKINATLENNLDSKVKTNVLSKGVVVLSGGSLASLQAKANVEIGAGAIVHINPPQVEPSPDSAANGNLTEKAGEMDPQDVIAKAGEYKATATKTTKQVRAGKVKEAVAAGAEKYGPKVIEKTGGTLPDTSKVKDSTLSKITDKVEEIASKVPAPMKAIIAAAAVKSINDLDAIPNQFSNLTSNTISKATSDIVNEQPDDDVLASVASTAKDTFDRDDIKFKSSNMEDMMTNDAGPYAKGVISSSTTEKVDPSDPTSPTIMEDRISDNIATEAVKKFATEERIKQGTAVYGSRGLL